MTLEATLVVVIVIVEIVTTAQIAIPRTVITLMNVVTFMFAWLINDNDVTAHCSTSTDVFMLVIKELLKALCLWRLIVGFVAKVLNLHCGSQLMLRKKGC